MPEISLKPEVIAHFGALDITNTLLSSVLMFSVLFSVLFLVSRSLSVAKPSTVQLFVETVYDGLGGMFKEITNHHHYNSYLFSFVFSFFIFIVASNWFGLLPFVSTFGQIHENKEHVETSTSEATVMGCIKERDCVLDSTGHIQKTNHLVPVFRAPTSDLSVTMALALLSVFATNILGVHYIGFSYLKKYFDFSSGINFFVGILEMISELGKIISFSFRLFGNIFAGEVLLTVTSFISFGVATLPFIGLEFFIGIIQALVFFMLTTVFISLAADKH